MTYWVKSTRGRLFHVERSLTFTDAPGGSMVHVSTLCGVTLGVYRGDGSQHRSAGIAGHKLLRRVRLRDPKDDFDFDFDVGCLNCETLLAKRAKRQLTRQVPISTRFTTDDLLVLSRARQFAPGEAARRREEAGWSQAELSRALGIAPATLWRWERGERRPTRAAAVAWARLLLCPDQEKVAAN